MYRIPPINLMPKPKARSFADVPREEISPRAVKLFVFAALTWDYVDTVLDIASQMRLRNGTQKVSRRIRELRDDYNRVRSRSLDEAHFAEEWRLAQLFEKINKVHLAKLNYALKAETSHDYALDEDYEMLVVAVQTAMTLLDALRMYAAECDAMIRRYYPAPHSILPPQVAELSGLVPLFAGNCYNAASEARRLTARILLNEINAISIRRDDGDE